jgi:hypothetical protein
MDKNELPPGGDPQDYMRTQEIGPVGAQPWQSGQPGGQAWGQQAGQAPPLQGKVLSGSNSPKPPRRRNRALLWGAGLALVALLAGGGAYAATALSSSASPAGPTGQAAQLNDILKSASSPTSAAAVSSFAKTTASTAAASHPCLARAAKLKAAGHPVAAAGALLRCRSALYRLRRLGGLHGSFTFKTKSGTATLAYQRGAIQSVNGNDVVVQSSDGTTWTWVLQSSTVIREGGKKTATSALADGEHVFAGGPVVSGAYDAKLIVIQKAQSSSTPSPSPSPASGS